MACNHVTLSERQRASQSDSFERDHTKRDRGAQKPPFSLGNPDIASPNRSITLVKSSVMLLMYDSGAWQNAQAVQPFSLRALRLYRPTQRGLPQYILRRRSRSNIKLTLHQPPPAAAGIPDGQSARIECERGHGLPACFGRDFLKASEQLRRLSCLRGHIQFHSSRSKHASCGG